MDKMEAEKILRPRGSDQFERRIAVYVKREAFVVMVQKFEVSGRVWVCEHPVASSLQKKIDAIKKSFALDREPIPGVTEYMFLKLGAVRIAAASGTHSREARRSAAAN